MARKPRIHYPGAFYHIMLRGNDKQVIFRDRRDVSRFEEILSQGLEEFSMRLYAYCWMKNHVHMALQVNDIPLPKMMQNLAQRYTGWFNFCHDRVGHLFQGRYKAILIDKDGYLWQLIRYIHMNPVRAELVKKPMEYKFSSHNAFLARVSPPDWLCLDGALGLFGTHRTQAMKNYLSFMKQPEEEEQQEQLRKGSQNGHILGDDDFVLKIQNFSADRQPKAKLSIEAVTELSAEKLGVDPDTITTKSKNSSVTQLRAVVAMIAVDCMDYTFTDAARYFGQDVSSVSRMVKRFKARMQKDEVLNTRIQTLIDNIII